MKKIDPSADILRKLQIKPASTLCVLGAPEEYEPILEGASRALTIARTLRGKFDVVHAFAKKISDVKSGLPKWKKAMNKNGMLWISYPKAGALGTDLNRDILHDLAETFGVTAVRQIAIDEVWSALRFKIVS